MVGDDNSLPLQNHVHDVGPSVINLNVSLACPMAVCFEPEELFGRQSIDRRGIKVQVAFCFL
jgi:hypothetical protein